MKKFLLLFSATLTLGFAGCMKDDGSYEKYQKIAPGIAIYNSTTAANTLSSIPADAAMRLSMLVAEGHKQGVSDLEKVEIKQGDKIVNVKAKLFGDNTKVERLSNGNYTITYKFAAMSYGISYEGVITVDTNGKALLSETDNGSSWGVTTSSNFMIKEVSTQGEGKLILKGGLTYLNGDADGRYVVRLINITAAFENSNFDSSWSGGFNIKPPVYGLAYSECNGEMFKVDGLVQGPSFYSINQSSSTGLKYEIKDGVYLNGTLKSARQICELTGTAGYDYPVRDYPSASVEVVLQYDEISKKSHKMLYYNGFEYEFK